jgi:hypothetical protein
MLVLWTQKLNAEKAQEVVEKENQMKLAEQKTIEANEQRTLAEQALLNAQMQTSRADSALNIAENRRLDAERNANVAANQTALATENLGEANRQRVLAINNEREAESQRQEAVLAKEEAFQRRMLSTARSMAVKSLQINEDPQLKGLLSYQAFRFYNEFNGLSHDVDIYSGLYQSVKSLVGDSYNVFKGHNNAVRSIAFIPNTSSFISAGSDGKLLKWNLNLSNTEPATILTGRNVIESVKITPNGKWILAAENRNGLLLIDALSGNTNPEKLNGGNDINIRVIAAAPDNNTVYTAGLNDFIEVWNISSRSVKKFTDTGSRVNYLSLSPNGNILAGGTRDGKIIIWRVTGDVLSNEIFNDPNNAVQSIQFSPDGKYLACGTLNGNILVFRADNFELAAILSGHTARVTELQFSFDSNKMASGSYDGKVYFWDVKHLTNPPIVMDDNSGFVFCVTFSPDGKYIVSGSTEEHRLIARPTSAVMLSERICPLVNRNLTKEEWNTYIGNDIEYRATCNY